MAFVSNVAGGAALGAGVGSIVPGIGTGVGAVVGGAAGALASIFGGSDAPATPATYTPLGLPAPTWIVVTDDSVNGVYHYVNTQTGATTNPGEVPANAVIQNFDGSLFQTDARGQTTPVATAAQVAQDHAYSLGGAFGSTPGQMWQDAAQVGAYDQGLLQQAGTSAQNLLGGAANSSFAAGQGILQGTSAMAAEQQQLGQQGLAQGQALSDYYNQMGQSALQGMSGLGAQANQASAFYGAQGNALLGQQQDLSGAGLAELSAIRQQANQAIGAMNGGANTSAGAQQYYGDQSAQYGQNAQNSQNQASASFSNLANQGQNNQQQLNALGNSSLQTGQALSNNIYNQGQSSQNYLQSMGTGSQQQGAQASTSLGNYGAQTQGNLADLGYEANQQGRAASSALSAYGQQNQAGLSGLGTDANQTAAGYGQAGMGQLGYSGEERASALQSVQSLRDFYNQPLDVPSAADAQFKLGMDQNMANAVSLARSGRGAGDNANAMRQAMFSNAATQQQGNLQYAQLRAQEIAAGRQAQLQGMGMEQSTLGNLRGQDISASQSLGTLGSQYAGLGQGYYNTGAQLGQAAQQAAGQLGQAYNATAAGLNQTGAQVGVGAQQAAGQLGLGYNQIGQGYNTAGAQVGQQATQAAGNLGLGFSQLGGQLYTQGAELGQNATNAAGQGMGALGSQQTGAQQATGQLGLGYGQLGQQYTQGAGNLGIAAGTLSENTLGQFGQQALQGASTAGQLGLGYANTGQAYYQGGLNAANAFGNTAQNALGTGLGFEQGMYGLGNQITGTGVGAYTNLSGQGNALLGQSAGVGLNTAGLVTGIDQQTMGLRTQMAHDQLSAYVSMYGADRGVAIAQAQAQATGDAALLSAVSTFGAGLLTSQSQGGSQPAAAQPASDERVKENVRGQVFDLRDAGGWAYEYIDPTMPGAAPGTHFGPMAQELERSPSARSAVVDGDDGYKRVDTSRLSLILASTVGQEQRRGDDLTKRLRRLEALLETT